jgi:Ca2+-binding EF-hand superfamily protein
LLCIWLVAAGIGLFGIPVGALFDAFQEVITVSSEQERVAAEKATAATVDAIFDEYDADDDGTVDAREMFALVHDDPQLAFLLFPAWAHSTPTEEEKASFISTVFSDKGAYSKDDVAQILARSNRRSNRRIAARLAQRK